MQTITDCEKTIRSALRELWNKDRSLLNTDASERAICHRLAIYIENILNVCGEKLNVDCEYNRMGLATPKRLIGLIDDKNPEGKSVYPDIIIHSRNNNLRNVLVLEVKKSSSAHSDNFDKTKIAGYIRDLGYMYGCCLLIKVDTICTKLNCDDFYAIEMYPTLPDHRAAII